MAWAHKLAIVKEGNGEKAHLAERRFHAKDMEVEEEGGSFGCRWCTGHCRAESDYGLGQGYSYGQEEFWILFLFLINFILEMCFNF